MGYTVSLVIPFYNEEAVLRSTIERCLALRERSEGALELIFVNDGSGDSSPGVAAAFEPQIKLVSYPDNRGKGYAVRAGVAASTGDIVATTDADLAYGTDAILQAVAHLRNSGADLLCGSRRLAAEGYSGYPGLRQLASGVFAAYVRLLLHIPVSDTQCGLKAFRGEVGRRLFSRCTVDRFAYDLELLGLAAQQGLLFTELPVAVQTHGDSKVSLLKDSVTMGLEVLRIRRRLRRNRKESD